MCSIICIQLNTTIIQYNSLDQHVLYQHDLTCHKQSNSLRTHQSQYVKRKKTSVTWLVATRARAVEIQSLVLNKVRRSRKIVCCRSTDQSPGRSFSLYPPVPPRVPKVRGTMPPNPGCAAHANRIGAIIYFKHVFQLLYNTDETISVWQ